MVTSSGNTWMLNSLNVGHGQHIDKLKDFICHEILESMIMRMLQNFGVKFKKCIAFEGKHLDNKILKTKWWQWQNKRVNIFLSYSKGIFKVVYTLTIWIEFILSLQNQKIILQDTVFCLVG